MKAKWFQKFLSISILLIQLSNDTVSDGSINVSTFLAVPFMVWRMPILYCRLLHKNLNLLEEITGKNHNSGLVIYAVLCNQSYASNVQINTQTLNHIRTFV